MKKTLCFVCSLLICALVAGTTMKAESFSAPVISAEYEVSFLEDKLPPDGEDC